MTQKHLATHPLIHWQIKIMILLLGLAQSGHAQTETQDIDPNENNGRQFLNEADTEFWMSNMVAYHHFTLDEIRLATGMKPAAILELKNRLSQAGKLTADFSKSTLTVMPYPGGRHPRIGFLDGAIRPQRETKVSVFLPWDRKSYVVVDVPEAVWSNLGLTYLAHTHIPTVFDKMGKRLRKLEWDRSKENVLYLKRKLPNGIEFSSRVVSRKDHVRMRMTLKNGTQQKLTDLRVQNCVMLKAAQGFDEQTNDNKRFIGPYVVCHDTKKSKWIITAWKPIHRPWANAPCPCLHSDPKFPDCLPGETQVLDGWLSFFEGTPAEIEAEVARIEKTDWWKSKINSD